MPLKTCKVKGKRGYRWGNQKCYGGTTGKAKALRQMRAIRASGWAENLLISNARNPLRADPTQTTTLRRRFAEDLRRRLNQIAKEIREVVEVEDAFGLRKPKPVTFNQLVVNEKYGAVMLMIEDKEVVDEVKRIQRLINPNDIEKLEKDTHITIRYGFTGEVKPEQIEQVVQQHSPIVVEIKGMSLFQNDVDVLKFDIESTKLDSFNGHLGIIPNVVTHGEYYPHLTVAYLKKGTGVKYLGLGEKILGKRVTPKTIVYSTPDREWTRMELINNVFCPTGKGGGIDPTCGKGGLKRREGYNYREGRDLEDFGNGVYGNGTKDVNPEVLGITVNELRVLKEAYPLSKDVTITQAMGGAAFVASAGRRQMIAVDEQTAKRLHESGEHIMDIGIGKKSAKVAQYYHDKDGYALSLKVSGPRGGENGWFGGKPEEFNKKYTSTSMDGVERKFSGKDTVRTVVAHEYGHFLTFEAGYSTKDLNNPPVVDIARRIRSNYAHTNWGETVAEAFAFKHMGGKDHIVDQFLEDTLFSRLVRNVYSYPSQLPEPELTDGPELIESGVFTQPEITTNSLTWNVQNQRWQFRTTPEQLAAFLAWLKERLDKNLLDLDKQEQDRYWQEYVLEGYKKGAGRAFDDVKKGEKALAGTQQELDFYQGTKEQFLRSSFGQPESVNKVKLLAGRVFTDLQGVTQDMSTKMSRVLTDGLVQGQNPRTIARALVSELEFSKTRAEVIARTEIIRAHAEGALDSLEELGVEEIGVMVEWDTAGDGRVCPKCQELDGVVLKIQEAHGLLPRHPNCRCAFLPANVGEPTKEQIRTKSRIESAIKRSVKVAGEDKWAGTEKTISKKRPEAVITSNRFGTTNQLAENMFCPTGKGGGIDPTCSPDKGGSFGGGAAQRRKSALAKLRERAKVSREKKKQSIAKKQAREQGQIESRVDFTVEKLGLGEKYKKEYMQWADSLSSEEMRAIKSYTGSGYDRIRKYQREKKGPASVAKQTKVLENALERAPRVKGDVYRGLSFSSEESREKYIQSFPSKSKTFDSTSLFRGIASSRVETVSSLGTPAQRSKKKFPLTLKITTTTGVDVGPLSKHPREREVVLLPGTRFRKVSRKGESLSLTSNTVEGLVEAVITSNRFGTTNVFCPTGKGGGIDPTCGKGGASGERFSQTVYTVKDKARTGFSVKEHSDDFFGSGVYFSVADSSDNPATKFYLEDAKRDKRDVEVVSVKLDLDRVHTFDLDDLGYEKSDQLNGIKLDRLMKHAPEEVLSSYKHSEKSLIEKAGSRLGVKTQDKINAATKAFKSNGYDAIRIKQKEFTPKIGGDQIVVFDPDKIGSK